MRSVWIVYESIGLAHSVRRSEVVYDDLFDDISENSEHERRAATGGAASWLPSFPDQVRLIHLLVVIGLCLAPIILFVVKPFVDREHLNQPVGVRQATADTLILTDGKLVSLPSIKRIPCGDPVFQAALEQGVDVDADGNVYGLLTVYPSCGN